MSPLNAGLPAPNMTRMTPPPASKATVMSKLLVLPLTLMWAGRALCADEPPNPAEPGTLVVIDAAGKEQKIKAWKFTAGVRALGWLATRAANDPPPETD